MEILDEELNALFEESKVYKDSPAHIKRLQSEASILQLDYGDHGSDMDDDFQPDDKSESSDDGEDSEAWGIGCIFDETQLVAIRGCLADAVIPSWLKRPPQNLGEKAHGKLKADQWLTLMSVFLPLILPEVWLTAGSHRDMQLLDNFHDLVSCTNIVCSYSTSTSLADEYLQHYIRYRQSSSTLFPNAGSRPNHHYAMHNAQLMKFWGPLIPLSEFGGERHNGALQKINTNQHLCMFPCFLSVILTLIYSGELDFTMLRQICRRGRLNALIADGASHVSGVTSSLKILTGMEVKPGNTKSDTHSQKIPDNDYRAIRLYLNSSAPTPYRHYKDLPHPLDAMILSPLARPLTHITHNSRVYSTSRLHSGNSSVSYRTPGGKLEAGIICSIWQMILPTDSTGTTLLVIAPYERLSPIDFSYDPYVSRSGFLCNVVYHNTTPLPNKIIETTHIVSHLPFYDRPPGTFGITRPIRILINSVYRGRD
jgi:hypothetical protein